jgi:ActR/RegA family two-component response regulator
LTTVEARLARKLIVFSDDAALRDEVARALPARWEATYAGSAAEVGEFQDVLLHRFALLDLDCGAGADPVDTVREIRGEMLLNIPIFCFGGDAAARDAARLARADRFFERDEIATRLPTLCESFAW